MQITDSDNEDAAATASFRDTPENLSSRLSSEEDLKDVDHALADSHDKKVLICRSGCYRPK